MYVLRAATASQSLTSTRGHQANNLVWYYYSSESMMLVQHLYSSSHIIQMGLVTQLLFTVIVTLMKVAILLTYLRKCTSGTHT